MLTNLKLTEKQSGFRWKDEIFLITSHISEEHLYLASRESIIHNGKLIFSTAGFGSRQSRICYFQASDGEYHKLELRCFPVRSNWLNFTVLIDDLIVYKGSTPIRGSLTSLLVYLPILFLITLMLGRVLGLFMIYFNL